jgi:peptide/nickel transport system substrate-binding protein
MSFLYRLGYKKTFIINILLITGLLTLSGCGSPATGNGDNKNTGTDNKNVTENKKESNGASSEPQYGGTLVIGQDVEPPSGIDPHKSIAFAGSNIVEHIYATLFRFNADLKPEPWLVESYENPDNLTYIMKLRNDVKFHSGKPVTSADVKYSFDRILDPNTGSPMRSVFEVLDKMETPDDYTVIFRFKEPFAPFLNYLSVTGAVVNKDFVEKNNGDISRVADGTGPFMLEEWKTGDYILFKKNPSYFEKGLPYLDGVKFKFLPDESTRLATLRSGQVDMTWWRDPSIIRNVVSDEKLESSKNSNTRVAIWALNSSKHPLDNEKVRQAISVGIDRAQLIKTVLYGQGGITLRIPPGHPPFGYDGDGSDIPNYTYDPELAKKLLKEAGYENGIDITITVPGSAGFAMDAALAEAMKAQLEQVGIRLNIKMTEWGLLLKEYSDISYESLIIPEIWYSDPDDYLYSIYHSEGAYSKTKDPKIDELLVKGRTTLDREERIKIYRELETYIAEKAYDIYVYASPLRAEAWQPYVEGYTPLPNTSRQFLLRTWLSK